MTEMKSMEEILRCASTHRRQYDKNERRNYLWSRILLMYIASSDNNCTNTFGMIPIELINYIEQFVISDPWVDSCNKEEQ